MRKGFFRSLSLLLAFGSIAAVVGLLFVYLPIAGYAVLIVVVFLLAVGLSIPLWFRSVRVDDSRPLAEWATSAGWEASTSGWTPIPGNDKVRKKRCECLKRNVEGVELKIMAPYLALLPPGDLRVGIVARTDLALPGNGRISVVPRSAESTNQVFGKLHALEESTQPVDLESLTFGQEYAIRADPKSARLFVRRIFSPDVIVRFEQAAARRQMLRFEYAKGVGTLFMEVETTPQGVMALVNEAVPLFSRINQVAQSP